MHETPSDEFTALCPAGLLLTVKGIDNSAFHLYLMATLAPYRCGDAEGHERALRRISRLRHRWRIVQ